MQILLTEVLSQASGKVDSTRGTQPKYTASLLLLLSKLQSVSSVDSAVSARTVFHGKVKESNL